MGALVGGGWCVDCGVLEVGGRIKSCVRWTTGHNSQPGKPACTPGLPCFSATPTPTHTYPTPTKTHLSNHHASGRARPLGRRLPIAGLRLKELIYSALGGICWFEMRERGGDDYGVEGRWASECTQPSPPPMDTPRIPKSTPHMSHAPACLPPFLRVPRPALPPPPLPLAAPGGPGFFSTRPASDSASRAVCEKPPARGGGSGRV